MIGNPIFDLIFFKSDSKRFKSITRTFGNFKNFNSQFESLDVHDVIDKFTLVVNEFLLCTSQNIIVQNEKYLLLHKKWF